MAIPTTIAGIGGQLADAVQIAPSQVFLLLLTVIVISLLYAYQPPLPQTMTFAFLPWIVGGLFLNVLVTDGPYPSYLVPLFSGTGAYLVAILVPGLAWVTMLNVTVSRRKLPAYHHYIGMMGMGVMLILWTVLMFTDGVDHLSRLLVLVMVPLISILATGLISLSIGLWCPDFVEYTAIAGAFVVFGALMNGIGTVTSVAVDGAAAHTMFSATVRDIVAIGAPNGLVVFDVTHLWVWLFIVTNVAVGIHVATQLAPYAHDSPRAVNAMLGFVGVVGFAFGFNHLLLVVVG